jgi:hypothetical protein
MRFNPLVFDITPKTLWKIKHEAEEPTELQPADGAVVVEGQARLAKTAAHSEVESHESDSGIHSAG